MKVDIEALAREKLEEVDPDVFVAHMDDIKAFARLIVEQCAITVEAEEAASVEFATESDVAYSMALEHVSAAIRQLLEDK